jgi:methionine-rich copper-binding protein CopC
MKHGRLIAAAATTGLVGSTLLLSMPAATAAPAMAKTDGKASKTVSLAAELTALNFSGASGTATATVKNQKIENITVNATGLAPDAPHAIHIHYGDDARNECPTMGEATNVRNDAAMTPRLSTADGLPAYGPIVVSLTTTGDTTPTSGLALDRFPVSTGGTLSYSRDKIEFTDVAGTGYEGTGTAKQIADSIREGEGVLVVHGNDYNDNGMYDVESAGASELDARFPAEGTDPTACGRLTVAH